MTVGYRKIGGNQVVGVDISTNGRPHMKTAGVTIAWSKVVAVTVQTTLPDGTIIPVGFKFLRYGQCMAEITAGGDPEVGSYGPFDPAAADGRQATPVNGRFGILRFTLIQNYPLGQDLYDSDHCGLVVGGRLAYERILMTTGAASLAAGPTVAQVEAALKTIEWVHI